MKNKDIDWRRYKKYRTWDNDPSVPFKVGTLGPHTVLPITISARHVFLNLTNNLKSLPFQRWFRFGAKPEVAGHLILVVGGWVTWVIWCFTKKLFTRRDAWAGVLLWWSCQSPVAHSCGLLNHLNSFRRGMFRLNAKFHADSLFYSLSHFECNGHTVHMLTPWCLPPPLTSTVKSSLFTNVHSSPLSLAARFHRCHTNHSRYVTNGWTFSRQTS